MRGVIITRQLDPLKLMPYSNNNLDTAIFICHLLTVDIELESGTWIPIRIKDWEVLLLSRQKVIAARNYFHGIGILDYKVKRDKDTNATFYRLNQDKLKEHLEGNSES